MNGNIFNVFSYGLTGVFLFLDCIVYWAVGKLFSLYTAIAGLELITSDMYNEIIQKFEVIIAVFMLFYIAYALLKSIINPDELSKNTSAIIKNFVISIVLLTVVPTIFNYAFKIQNIIIFENKIGVLLLGDEADSTSVEKTGNTAALSTLEAFLEVEKDTVASQGVWSMSEDEIKDKEKILDDTLNCSYDSETGKQKCEMKWKHIQTLIKSGQSEHFLTISYFIEEIHEESGAKYIPIISTVCGCFLIYVLVSFCIDLGIRTVKMAFYQIIAPVPILMRIVPEKKSVFDNWLKATLNTFLEVFIRIFIMYLVIFLIDLCTTAFLSGEMKFNQTMGDIGTLGLIIVIMGLFAFAKQAPKLISDVIGIDAGNLKLGIKDKLKADNYLGGNLVSGIGSRAAGLTTGFLGGAFSAKANGGSFWKGGLAGGANGYRGKGNQFGKQHQAIYGMTGGKGKAGLFGGRSFIDSQLYNIQENARKNMKDAYKNNQQRNVEKFENSSQFQNVMQDYKNTQVTAAETAYNEALRLYNENQLTRENFENSAEYNGIMSRYYNQASAEATEKLREKLHEYSATPEGREKYKKDKELLTNNLQRKYTYQELASNTSNGLASNAGKEYIEAMQTISQLDNQLRTAQQNLAAAQADNASAEEYAREYFTSGEGKDTKAGKTYKSSVEYMDKVQQEKAVKDYLKSEAGQRAVAVEEAALKAREEAKKKGEPSKPKNDKK